MEASLVWSSRRVAPRSVMVVVAVSDDDLLDGIGVDSTGAVQEMSPTVRKRTCAVDDLFAGLRQVGEFRRSSAAR